MPPPEAAEVAVAQSVELALPLLAVPAAAALLVEPELLHPAASRIDPTAAAAATIAFDARKVNPPVPAPVVRAPALASWLDNSHPG
jgi:hypothetical protein